MSTPTFPAPHPERLAEPIIHRKDAVNGSFRYTILPATCGLRGSYPFSIIVECLYDCGTLITNFWSSVPTLEEAKDELHRLDEQHHGREYQKRIIYSHNQLSGWTESSAQIEARKKNSPKRRNGYRWEAIADTSCVCHNRGRFILKGTRLDMITA